MPDSRLMLEHDRQKEHPATRLVNELSLLVKTESVYRSWSERGKRLAAQLAEFIEEFGSGQLLTVYRNGHEFEVEGEVIDGAGRRRDLLNRLRALNLKCLSLRPGVTGEHLQQFAALLNGRFRELMANGTCAAEWAGMPETIELDEAYYDPQGQEDNELLREVPRLYLTYRKLKRLIRQLQDLQDKLSEMGEEQTRAVDVIRTLLETLKEIETCVPEQAEALIEKTLERFQAALNRVRESGISTEIGGLLQDVAKKYFPRLTADGEIVDPTQSEGEDEASDLFEFESERLEYGEVEAFAQEIDALLAADHPTPVLEPPSDRAQASVLTRFLDEQENPTVLGAVAHHLTALCTRTDDPTVVERVKQKLLARIGKLANREPVKPLISALVDASDVESILDEMDLYQPENLELFLEIAGALWPEVLPGLFAKLHSAPRAEQVALMKPLLRREGREAILGAGDWLRANVLNREDMRRWIRALQIPETLPLVEVLFDSANPAEKRLAWLLARPYPFEQKASFWLKAAPNPLAITNDYFRGLLEAEWSGEQDYPLYHAQLEMAKAWALGSDPEAARMGVRALAIADTDETAGFLIGLLQERKWVIFRRHPAFLRHEARVALSRMRCQKATYWKVKMKG